MSDPRTAPYGSVNLADVVVATDIYPDYPDRTDGDFHMIRRHFDIRSFGVNAVTGDAGDELIEPHDERDDEEQLTDGHEELFAVVIAFALVGYALGSGVRRRAVDVPLEVAGAPADL